MAEVDNINVLTEEVPDTYTNDLVNRHSTIAPCELYATVDISDRHPVIEEQHERPGKKYDPEDLPWKRKYLYGLDETGYPVCYRFIPKSKFEVWKIRQEMDTMLADHHDIAMIFVVDNSKNLHEAFNRAKSGYRPAEDKAIFMEMLYQYGIKLFPVYAIDSIE